MIEILAPDFDLAMTLDSGQVFHWQRAGNGFVGMIADLPLYVEQENDLLKVRCGATPQPARETRALPRSLPARSQQPLCLAVSAHDIETLNRLAARAFHQVVDRAHKDEAARARI
jgi:8-oxoguanine DNA glycosylase, N-terminal domain